MLRQKKAENSLKKHLLEVKEEIKKLWSCVDGVRAAQNVEKEKQGNFERDLEIIKRRLAAIEDPGASPAPRKSL